MSSKINEVPSWLNDVERGRWRRRLIEGAVIELRMLKTCVKLRLDTEITKQVRRDHGDEGVRALRRGELKLANELWVWDRESAQEKLTMMVEETNHVLVNDNKGYTFVIKKDEVMYSEIDPDWKLS